MKYLSMQFVSSDSNHKAQN